MHQRLDGASELDGTSKEGGRFKGWRAPQKQEGRREWRGLMGWRALQRLDGASELDSTSKDGGRFKGWRAPQKQEGAAGSGEDSWDGGRFRG